MPIEAAIHYMQTGITFMPIPAFASNGWLPSGVYDATIDEIKERFGQTQGSDRRPNFVAQLVEYLKEAEECNYIICIIVNGSFVSEKPHPGDIDILVVLSTDYDLTSDKIPLWEHNLLHKKRVRSRYKCLDVLQAPEGSHRHLEMIRNWGVDEKSGEPKGMLRILV